MTGFGAITPNWDVASLVFTLFILFFIGLVVYLTLESKREGFPLESERFGQITNEDGLIMMPKAKVFHTESGQDYFAPLAKAPAPEVLNAQPAHHMSGAPLIPVGNPLLAGVGPGSYANRADVPDVGLHGEPRIVPLSRLPSFKVHPKDINPIGMSVYGADLEVAGTVCDLWVDHMESMIRYLEIRLPAGDHVLVPQPFALNKADGVKVQAILADQFTLVPKTKSNEQITLLEEEKIMAYFGAGLLYATPDRQEPRA
ncbi:MAG: photosynthetic reaction center subunit H [Betaproteobacteria bacterium]|jgi:photosynthetic reaction center H subunit